MSTQTFCVIEDGYNTSYISTLLFALFYNPSVIERCLIHENDTHKLNGMLLQKTIETSFIEPLRKKIPIESKSLNKIRTCASVIGWKNSSKIGDLCQEYDPIEFLIFLCHSIHYVPIDTLNGKLYKIDLEQKNKSSVQEMYDNTELPKIICSIPQFVIVQISPTSVININKKIRLFPKEHEYHMLKWDFFSLIYQNNDKYSVVVNNELELNELVINNIPYLKKVDVILKNKFDKIYLIYTKEPIV